jgi:hypothetical protein
MAEIFPEGLASPDKSMPHPRQSSPTVSVGLPQPSCHPESVALTSIDTAGCDALVDP